MIGSHGAGLSCSCAKAYLKAFDMDSNQDGMGLGACVANNMLKVAHGTPRCRHFER